MIHICIYSFYKDPFLLNCLKSIKESSFQDYAIDLYIYSVHEEPNILELKEDPKIGISILNKRKSFAEVSNLSITTAKQTNRDFFLLLNSDTVLQKNSLSNLIEIFSFKGNLGVVGGFQTEYEGEWNKPNEWTKLALINSHSVEKIRTIGQDLTLHKCDYVQGACMLMKLAIFDEVGLFDERFKLFYEETELCRRIRNKLFDVFILEEAKVKHFSGGTWKRSIFLQYRRDVFYLTNQIIFESTESSTTKTKLLREVFIIIQKQIKNLWNKNDDHKLPVVFYPVILLNLIFKSKFLMELYETQSVFLLK